jgi:hypothetical protein
LFCYLDLQLSDDSDVDPTVTLGDLSGSSSEESERDIGDNILNHYLHNYLSTLKIINHKFLVAGHIHMECDHDRALIEKKKKKRSSLKINHLNDWVELIRTCKRYKPLTVKQLNLKDFFDFTSLAKNWYKRGNILLENRIDESTVQ